MSEQNPPPSPQPEPQPGVAGAGAEPAQQAVPPVKRRRRRWPWVILALLVLIGLLVLLAPTIASTAPVRHYVVGKVNQNLNGRLEVASWSIGWTGGIEANGIRVYDERGAEVMSIARVRTGLTLMDAIGGRYHCGQTVVDEPNLVQFAIHRDGTTTLDDLLKKGETSKEKKGGETARGGLGGSAAAKTAKLPDVSGEFTINRLRGTVVDERMGDPVIVDPSTVVVKVKSLSDPIDNAVNLVFRVGTAGSPGTLKLDGSAQVASNGAIDVNAMKVDENLQVASLPLQGLNPFLAVTGQKLVLAGVADGALAVKVAGINQISANGRIDATQFAASGEALEGDRFATSKLTIPMKVATATTAAGTQLRIEALGVESPEVKLAVDGDLSQEALLNVIHNKAPGSDGKLAVSLSVPNVKPIADQLPHVLRLQKGVALATGQLYAETNLWLSKEQAVVSASTDVQGVTGTNNGQPVALAPIHQTFDATLEPSQMAALPDVRDLSVTLDSEFASIKGGGKTLANLKVTGDADLPKLRQQLGQLVDFGQTKLEGTAKFAITTEGDLTSTSAPIQLATTVSVTNLVVDAGPTAAAPTVTVTVTPVSLPSVPPATNRRRRRTDAPAPVEQQKAAKGAAATTSPAPLPLLKVVTGTAQLNLTIARDVAAKRTTITAGTLAVPQLALERGPSRYTAPGGGLASVAIAGEMTSGSDHVRGVTLSKLDGTLLGGPVKLVQPLVVSGLDSSATKVAGGIDLSGTLDELMRLLDTVGAKPADQTYPYRGGYHLTQSVTTDGSALALVGSGTLSDFKVLASDGKGEPAFSEKQVALSNNVRYDPTPGDVKVNELKLDATSSDALHVALSGAVKDLSKRRTLDGVKGTLGYDLAKIWAIVYPMLSPEDQKDLKDAVLAGKYSEPFELTGSYPAGVSFNQAITNLSGKLTLAFDKIDADGVTLGKGELPIALSRGVVTTPKDLKPVDCNGGQMSLAGIVLDMTNEDMRLSTPKDMALLKKVTINPLLGDRLGKYVNPVFPNSERAKGLLDVTVNSCDRVALGAAMKTERSGSGQATFSIRDMDIANPLGRNIVASVMKAVPADLASKILGGRAKDLGFGSEDEAKQADVFDGSIENAVITLDRGRTTQDVTLQLVDPSASTAGSSSAVSAGRAGGGVAQAKGQTMPLRFQGDIRLSDLAQDLDVTFPTQLITRYIPDRNVSGALARAFPQGIPISLGGTTDHPKPDVGDILQRVVKSFAPSDLKQVIPGADGGKGKGEGGVDDAINNVLGQVLGGKKKEKDKDKSRDGDGRERSSNSDERMKDDAPGPGVTAPGPDEPPARRRGRRPRSTTEPAAEDGAAGQPQQGPGQQK